MGEKFSLLVNSVLMAILIHFCVGEYHAVGTVDLTTDVAAVKLGIPLIIGIDDQSRTVHYGKLYQVGNQKAKKAKSHQAGKENVVINTKPAASFWGKYIFPFLPGRQRPDHRIRTVLSSFCRLIFLIILAGNVICWSKLICFAEGIP